MADRSELMNPILKIREILPHRYPFLLVDKILKIEPGPLETSRQGRKATVVKCVTSNEMHFNGHFPQEPIMPGVLILESIAQAGGIASYLESDPPMDFLISRVQDAKFRKPVVPGDQMIVHAEVLRDRGKILMIRGEVKVNQEIVCEAEIMAYVSPRQVKS